MKVAHYIWRRKVRSFIIIGSVNVVEKRFMIVAPCIWRRKTGSIMNPKTMIIRGTPAAYNTT